MEFFLKTCSHYCFMIDDAATCIMMMIQVHHARFRKVFCNVWHLSATSKFWLPFFFLLKHFVSCNFSNTLVASVSVVTILENHCFAVSAYDNT